MSGRQIDLATWDKAEQFRWFRAYDRPHFAITTRLDVSHLMLQRKARALSPFRSCLWSIGAGLHAIPALRTRFDGDKVTIFDRLHLSPTIALDNGDFRYTYIAYDPDRPTFDAKAKSRIAAVRGNQPLGANDRQAADVAYLSCLPWLDYTALDNALPGPDDCIPRVSWGRITAKGEGYDMAITLQVHHALVDGRQVGAFFEATQSALATL